MSNIEGRKLNQKSEKTGEQSPSTVWKQENSEAIKSSNDWVEKNGLALDQYRQF